MWIIWEGTILRSVIWSRLCLYKLLFHLCYLIWCPIFFSGIGAVIRKFLTTVLPNLRYQLVVPLHPCLVDFLQPWDDLLSVKQRIRWGMIYYFWYSFDMRCIFSLNKSWTIINRIHMLIVIYREEMAWQNAQTILEDVRENLTRSKNFNIPTG